MNRRTALLTPDGYADAGVDDGGILGFGFAAGADWAATRTVSAAAQGDSIASLSRARRTSFIERRDGTALFYRDWGSGRPVLFVHGAGIDSDLWMHQMASFVNAGLRCIAFDRRGHGRSSDPGRGTDCDTLADDIAAIVETLDLKDVAIIGHSVGCGDVVRYLTRQGAGRVARVALVGPITDGGFHEELTSIELPTLILHGTTDVVTHRERVNADLLSFLL